MRAWNVVWVVLGASGSAVAQGTPPQNTRAESSASRHLATCDLEGHGLSHRIRITPRSAPSFWVHVTSEQSLATLSARTSRAVIHTQGALVTRGTTPTDALEVELSDAVQVGGVLTLGDRAFRPEELRLERGALRATLTHDEVTVPAAALPCDALELVDGRQRRAWSEGYAEEPARTCSFTRACEPPDAACVRAYDAGRRARQRTRRASAPTAPASDEERVPRRSTLRVAARPGGPGLPLEVHAPGAFILHAVETRGAWTRVRRDFSLASHLEGWVLTRELRAPEERPMGLGSLGTLGHGGGGECARGVVVVLERGSSLYASEHARVGRDTGSDERARAPRARRTPSRPRDGWRERRSARRDVGRARSGSLRRLHAPRHDARTRPGPDPDHPGRRRIPRQRARPTGRRRGHPRRRTATARARSCRQRPVGDEPDGSLRDSTRQLVLPHRRPMPRAPTRRPGPRPPRVHLPLHTLPPPHPPMLPALIGSPKAATPGLLRVRASGAGSSRRAGNRPVFSEPSIGLEPTTCGLRNRCSTN